jgi:hypothetical protein
MREIFFPSHRKKERMKEEDSTLRLNLRKKWKKLDSEDDRRREQASFNKAHFEMVERASLFHPTKQGNADNPHSLTSSSSLLLNKKPQVIEEGWKKRGK